MGKIYIYHGVLRDEVVPKKIPGFQKKKILTNIKNYNLCTSVFHFITVLVLERFLSSALVISPQKKAPTSHFYSSQHVEDGREKAMSYVHRVSGIHRV